MGFSKANGCSGFDLFSRICGGKHMLQTNLAGKEYGVVDAFFAPVIFRVQSYGLQLSQPAQSYVERMLSLPSMQRWYAEALVETWRKPEYEQAAVANGKIVRDFRK